MDVQLIPAPRELALTQQGGDQSFTLDQHTTINSGPGTERATRWLHGVLTAATGLPLPPTVPQAAGVGRRSTVTLAIDDRLAMVHGPEAYLLTVTPRAITITGGGSAGVMWGAQTLRQLLGPDAYRRAAPRVGTSAWGVAVPADVLRRAGRRQPAGGVDASLATPSCPGRGAGWSGTGR